MGDNILTLENITKTFGGLVALNNVSFELHKGEILGLIGPNGAGKTTLFNIISGFYKPNKGKIIFKNNDITKKHPYNICKLGITRTFQIVKPFGDLTVLDNVIVGALCRTQNMRIARDNSNKILDLTKLTLKKDQLACNLNISERKQLEIARALATQPEILLLDEVIAGLNPSEAAELANMIKNIRDENNISILLIEHVMNVIMNISDRVCVLNYGELIAQGVPTDIVKNEKVIEVYLGKRYNNAITNN